MVVFMKKFVKILFSFLGVFLIVTLSACNKPISSNSSSISTQSTEESTLKSLTQSTTESLTQSTKESVMESQSQSSQSNSSIKVPSNEEMQLIGDFVKYSKDAGTAIENIGQANTSSSKYADVPDLYINYYEEIGKVIYASPNGNSENSGTKEKPYDITTAIKKLYAGYTLFLLEGTYELSSTISLSRSGTRKDYINITAYEKKTVVLDFSAMELSSSNCGIKISGDYWHISGITVKGAGDNGIYVKGDYNVIDDCIARGNRDTGIQIGGGLSSVFSEWPHDNLIRNCTSFDNCCETGENADGFAAKLNVGNNNTFDGCIAHNNIDDGWDLYAYEDPGSIGRVIIVNSIAIYNGQLLDGTVKDEGDRNGYKLGSSKDLDGSNHYVYNCYAFKNYSKGYTDNWNKGQLTLENCTSHDNFNANYKLNGEGGDEKIIKNLLSIKPSTNEYDKYLGVVTNSLFHKEGYYYIKNASGSDAKITTHGELKNYNYEDMVVSLDAPKESENLHSLLRNSDGTINLGDYLKLKDDCPWLTMGENGTPLGANLNKSSYNLSVEQINSLILELPTASYTSSYYSQLYKVAKGCYNLNSNDLARVENLDKLISSISAYNSFDS